MKPVLNSLVVLSGVTVKNLIKNLKKETIVLWKFLEKIRNAWECYRHMRDKWGFLRLKFRLVHIDNKHWAMRKLNVKPVLQCCINVALHMQSIFQYAFLLPLCPPEMSSITAQEQLYFKVCIKRKTIHMPGCIFAPLVLLRMHQGLICVYTGQPTIVCNLQHETSNIQ